jgi:DHA2 family multidrug resistance protein
MILTFIVGAMLFGGSFLMPLFLGRVRDFSASEVGTTMVISGLAMFLTAPIAGRLARFVDMRIMMCGGFILCAWGMWDAHSLTSEWGFWEFAGVQATRGCGVMIAMIATNQITMATLPPDMVKNASGLVNLSRNVGGAFGLALLNTSLTRNTAVHMGELTSGISQTNSQVEGMIAGIAERMSGSIDPQAAALKVVHGMLSREATTLAFGDAFALLAVASGVAVIAALFAKPVTIAPNAPPVEVH